MINIFVALFRAIEIALQAVPLPVSAVDNSHLLSCEGFGRSVPSRYVSRVSGMIKAYHVEASLDLFNVQQQLFFLAPGQRLVYRHNFAGMFNDISQVIYFHYPDYVRSPQVSIDQMSENAMNSLSCLVNIIPQLRVMYDDDPWLPFGLADASEWVWIVSVKRVYLWDGKQKKLLASTGSCFFFVCVCALCDTEKKTMTGKGILDLAAYYLLCNCGLEFFKVQENGEQDGNAEDTEQLSSVRMTDFSHARLVKRSVSLICHVITY
jgi:hypothetical protein